MNKSKQLIFFVITSIVGSLLFVNAAVAAATSKKLIIAVGQEPSSIDPSLVYTTPDYVVVDNWTEYLISKTPNGDLKPGLTTSWKVSPDGKEIEFTLRRGVRFHSGDPLTVKDVEFSFERQRAKNPTVRTRLKSMERFEAIDDYRFKIHFKTVDVTFIPNRGVAVLSKSYYDRVGEDQFVRQPVSTSPYKFVRHVPGEYVDIERFEGYWGDKPSVKEARILFVPEDSTRIAKLRAGEVDLIGNCPYPMVKDIEKSTELRVIRFENNHPTASVTFSTRNPKTPWHSKRVRLAMAYAIDCDAIVKNILHGIPNRWPFLAPHELGYDPNLKNYPYNPKKAKELLAEAGYPEGFEFKFYWPITGRLPMSREVAEAIASYFEAVGIRTKLMGEEFVSFEKRQRASKGPEVEYVNLGTKGRAGGSDPSYFLDLFFGGDGGFSLYENPELDKIIAEAKTTVDEVKRAELIKKAVRLIQEEVPTIPIYNTVSVYAMKKNLDFKPTLKHTHDLVLVKDITVR